MNKSSRMADLLAITSRLISCMEREVELLRAMKPKDLRQLQHDKSTLSDAYRAFVLALKEPDMAADAVTDVLKEELTEATERFQAALQDNLRALRAMRDVNERVMRAVVEALEEPRLQVTGYNQRGALRRGRRQPAIGPAAIQQRA
ncbi:MAG: hypothetical protein C0484_16065 [Rhodospirillum sp.]|jgi:hypothetical protein|nr:hypothetical protein [Rhodospirillum sp.]